MERGSVARWSLWQFLAVSPDQVSLFKFFFFAAAVAAALKAKCVEIRIHLFRTHPQHTHTHDKKSGHSWHFCDIFN